MPGRDVYAAPCCLLLGHSACQGQERDAALGCSGPALSAQPGNSRFVGSQLQLHFPLDLEVEDH